MYFKSFIIKLSIPKSYDFNKLNISHVLEIIALKNNQESNSKSIHYLLNLNKFCIY